MNLAERLACDGAGRLWRIVTMLDRDGDDTSDCGAAVVVIAQCVGGERWAAIDLRCFGRSGPFH